MADFVDNIADYLATQSIGTVGTTIFVGKLPPSPDACVAVLGRPGQSPVPSRYIKDLFFPGFQIIVRAADYASAFTKMAAVRSALHVKLGLQLTDYFVLTMQLQGEAGHIGQDDKGRDEFSANFYAEYRAQTA